MSNPLEQAILASIPDGPSGGVVRVERGGEVLASLAWGDADRRHGLAMRPDARLAMASGSKGFTALAALGLVVDGALRLDTPARSLLGRDLPLISDEVTVEHLISHRSGIGDYIDDDADDADYLLDVPVHRLLGPSDYLPMLAGVPSLFAPGTDFSYCNAGFIVLSLLIERAGGLPFHQVVSERVFEPAGMVDTAYLRSDALPRDAALGYLRLDGQWVTNVLHLPIVGGGDGGAYTTAADLGRFWDALMGGRIVPTTMVDELSRARSEGNDDHDAYGLGFWLRSADRMIYLEGMDAGVSMRSGRMRGADLTFSVLATTADAAWPVLRSVQEWARQTTI